MLRNYFKIAWRSIKRHKVYSIINILGLTLGISSCLVIFLIARYELGYDAWHKKADRTYRVTLNAIDFNPSVSMAIAPAMRNDFPELEKISQVWYSQNGVIKVGANRYQENKWAFADQDFLGIFDYQWLAGDPNSALKDPNSIVLTESAAKKYFGKKEAMGQTLNMFNQFELKVTGLIKDVPGNTNLPIDFLISFETVRKDMGDGLKVFYWIRGGAFTYIVLPQNMSAAQLQKRIPAFIEKNWGKDIAKEARLPLQPLRDIHFDQRYLNNTISPTTSRETYWALGIVAAFIIIIACINFVNLATAQAIKRAREIGVRKVLGSNRSQLVWQFLGETTFMVMVATVLALLATRLFLPKVAAWLNIKIEFSQVMQPNILLMLGALVLVIILLAGLYPAFIQSAFKPAQSLKTKTNFSFKGLALRKGLVITQFAISQILIIGTLVVAYQMDFFQNRDLGFNKDAVINVDIPDMAKREVLAQQLVSNPGVKDVSFSSGAPTYNGNFCPFHSKELGVDKDDVTELKFIDEKFTKMFELKMLAGESIRKTNKTRRDSVFDVVVNETLINKLGVFNPQDAINKHIQFGGDVLGTIIGVVHDFQTESKHKKRRPIILMYREDALYTASVKLEPQGIHNTIEKIDKAWSALFPTELFSANFVDDHIATFYQQEQKTYTAFKLFSFIAILIGCLGLYGLILFATAQRTKEVGIRKVLGASVANIISLFAREFVWLIIIAFVVATPLAYYVMHNWLNNFAYKINIGAEIFVIAIASSFLIAAVTIAYQAIKAAVVNPVKSLRTE